MKLSIEHYVSTNNPQETQKFLEKYNVPKAFDMPDLIAKVHYITRKNKDFAFNELAKIDTPYRQLILSSVKPEVVVTEVKKEAVSNACGCSGADGTSNACGCSGADGETSNCSGCGGTCGKSSNIDGKTAPKSPETKTEKAPEVKESQVPLVEKKSMGEYMPLAMLGVIVIAAVLIAKH